MLVLALDTTTRQGSVALARDGTLVEVRAGDGSLTHAARLPGELVRCLDRHDLSLAEVDVFAVASGPGSFTGLRIGIATVQGLAFAAIRPVVAVSALDALAYAADQEVPGAPGVVGAWMDAQRREVYAALYERGRRDTVAIPEGEDPGAEPVPGSERLRLLSEAEVRGPSEVLESWRARLVGPVIFIGDGAVAYRSLIAGMLGPGATILEHPPLAASIAAIASSRAALGMATSPHAIRPFYVRRPDAELARDRRAKPGPADGPGSAS